MSQHLNFEPIACRRTSCDSLHNNKGQNQKVLSSLKEELTNLRQGMSKLIKIKSQEGIGLKRVITNTESNKLRNANINDANFGKVLGLDFKNIPVKNSDKLTAKVMALQQQNMTLRQKIADLQEQNNKIRKNQRNCILELQTHIKQLNSQLQYLKQNQQNPTKHNKHCPQTSSPKKTLNKFDVNEITVSSIIQQQSNKLHITQPMIQQLVLNPEKQIFKQMSTGPHHNSNKIHKMEQEQRRAHDKINKLQQKIGEIQGLNKQQSRLIDSINQESVRSKLKRLNAKYQYY